MIRSPHPSFENPGAATATVPTPSSTLAPSVAQPDPQLLQPRCALALISPYHFFKHSNRLGLRHKLATHLICIKTHHIFCSELKNIACLTDFNTI